MARLMASGPISPARASEPMKPPAKVSPAPVGSRTSSSGSAGRPRPEAGEDAGLGVERGAAVEIGGVLAAQAEGRAGRALEHVEIDAAAREELDVLLGKVAADDGHEAHVRREVGRRDAAVG